MDRSRAAAAAGGHLDVNAGQEVVFCHICSNEWYRPEAGLECPRCESDMTEIVDLSSDPRDLSRPVPAWPVGSTSSPGIHTRHFDDDSDPDEADIENELDDPRGFFFRRNVASGPDAHHHDPHFDHAHHHHHHHDPHDHDHEHVHFHQHHHPGHNHNHNHDQPDMDPIFSRFTEMFRGFQGQQGPGGGAGGGNAGPRVQTTTFRHSNGTMNATVTMFTSGPMGTATSGGGDPFQETFNTAMRDMDQPPAHPAMQNPHFTSGIQDLMSLLLGGANGRVGDAVYTQEALDEIISNLMDQNPQQHGAPPATASALENLERKPVTKEMLDGEDKTDCTICLDDVKVGDQACFLPCKHWFHEDCVTAWLRAHNTCPVCRSPIETDEQRRAAADSNNNNNRTEPDGGARLYPEGEAPDPDEADPSSLNEDNNAPRPPFATRPRMPQNPSLAPDVNTVIRAVSNWQQNAIRHQQQQQQQQQQNQPTRFHIHSGPNFSISYGAPPSNNRSQAANAAANAAAARFAAGSRVQGNPPRPTPSDADAAYDTANLQRRTSFSPTSTRAYVAGSEGASSSRRERSPTRGVVSRGESEEGMSTGRDQTRGGQAGSQGQGAFEWLRNRITGRGEREDGEGQR